jgi:membrane-bound ClpP family serine protease
MVWLYVIVTLLEIVGVAFLFGWADKAKNTAAQWAIIIGFLLLLIWQYGKGSYVLLILALVLHILALVLHILDHIPPFVGWMTLGSIVYFFYEYRFRVTAAAVLEVLAEVEKTNDRIELLENLVRNNLDDIKSQLPKRNEPSENWRNR